MIKPYDFGGWATRNDLKCSDGRVIRKDAFKHNDGKNVPLVWNHQHNDPMNILGHAILENREEGVYAYCNFNDTESGKNAKLLVEHGDVKALSIYANQLKHNGANVIHGAIHEVSLVLAGANPGAYIDSIMAHGEKSEEEGIIYTGEDIVISHALETEEEEAKEPPEEKPSAEEEIKHAEASDETVADVFATLSEKQQVAVHALMGEMIKTLENEMGKGEDTEMKHNVFDTAQDQEDTLKHAEELASVLADGKRHGSLRESALVHGIENIEYLFPDAKNLTTTPISIARDMGWVKQVMNGVHKTPFSRIKSLFADLTEDEARAKGYLKGKMKKEEFFSLLKRTTLPHTIYKKQKLERDDVIDITDFDIVAWIKTEMRMMLDEEIARAILIGDGRMASDDDHIDEQHIRPIWKDADLYTVKARATSTEEQMARAFIRLTIESRKDYKGSGNPTLYTTESMLAACLLIEDTTGRMIYDSVQTLANVMRVKEIITVPVMESQKRTVEGSEYGLKGIIVNLSDYNVGADKGGAVNMFDDFDIDYNAQKYLIETRCSGALTKPYSAIALEIATD